MLGLEMQALIVRRQQERLLDAAARERLRARARQPRRPLRDQLCRMLRALADRLDSQPASPRARLLSAVARGDVSVDDALTLLNRRRPA